MSVASIPRGGQEQGRCSDLKGMAGQHAAASTHHPEIGEKLFWNRGCVHFHLKKKAYISISAGLRKVDVLLVTSGLYGNVKEQV